MGIDFFRHDLGREELDAIAEVFAGPILTTGDTVRRFEERFAAYLGRRHAIAVTSCTGALHLSLRAKGIGPGDEVISTPMTFIATATAIIEAGARPVFVDVEPETGNIDAAKIEAAITPRTRGIVPVHLYGHLCDMRAIRAIADRHNLAIVEDAAHCIEGNRDGVNPGQLADTACFSFYATKNLSCGEGGAIVTDDDELAQRLRLMRLHGMTSSAAHRQREGYRHWDMVTYGWKYNLDNIHAAILLPQLDRLEAKWQQRAALVAHYQSALARVPGVRLPAILPGTRHAHHLFPAWLEPTARDEAIAALQQQGISVMVNYRAIHELTYFRETLGHVRGDFPEAERIGDSTISLPFYPGMPFDHADRVAECLAHVMMQVP
jgi:dTDP-4-amino-4,6-dideoxygalactose transaminase